MRHEAQQKGKGRSAVRDMTSCRDRIQLKTSRRLGITAFSGAWEDPILHMEEHKAERREHRDGRYCLQQYHGPLLS